MLYNTHSKYILNIYAHVKYITRIYTTNANIFIYFFFFKWQLLCSAMGYKNRQVLCLPEALSLHAGDQVACGQIAVREPEKVRELRKHRRNRKKCKELLNRRNGIMVSFLDFLYLVITLLTINIKWNISECYNFAFTINSKLSTLKFRDLTALSPVLLHIFPIPNHHSSQYALFISLKNHCDFLPHATLLILLS